MQWCGAKAAYLCLVPGPAPSFYDWMLRDCLCAWNIIYRCNTDVIKQRVHIAAGFGLCIPVQNPELGVGFGHGKCGGQCLRLHDIVYGMKHSTCTHTRRIYKHDVRRRFTRVV